MRFKNTTAAERKSLAGLLDSLGATALFQWMISPVPAAFATSAAGPIVLPIMFIAALCIRLGVARIESNLDAKQQRLMDQNLQRLLDEAAKSNITVEKLSEQLVQIEFDADKDRQELAKWIKGVHKELSHEIEPKLDDVLSEVRKDTELLQSLSEQLADHDADMKRLLVGLGDGIGKRIGKLERNLSQAAPKYPEPIWQFREQYLENNGQPVPFGGRDHELKLLNEWLDDDLLPYRLLCAPAGRGKSALIVRWLESIEDRDGIEVVFFPVSSRFDINLRHQILEGVTGQLAGVFNEPPPRSELSVDAYRETIAQYLTRSLGPDTKLVVVIDGIDESPDWGNTGAGLFPLEPGSGIRVLVSARLHAEADEQMWLDRLNWKDSDRSKMLPLALLDKPGLADVLRGMGLPLDTLANQDKIVSALHRLTDYGDPFLVGLYVDELWDKANSSDSLLMKPKYLDNLKPGLDGFFKRWMDALEKERTAGLSKTSSDDLRRHVQWVFDVLACAFGPLRLEDLQALLESQGELSGQQIRDAIGPIKRFLVGDWDLAGCDFCHPKFREFVFDKLTQRDRRKWDNKFVGLGLNWLEVLKHQDSQLSDPQQYRYAVRFLRSHLHRLKAPVADLLPLLSTRAWADAWYKIEGAYGGYLADIAYVRSSARDEILAAAKRGEDRLPHLGVAVRSALICSSVHTIGKRIDSKMVTKLVVNEVWTVAQGLAFTRQFPSPSDRYERLLSLSYVTPSGNMRQKVLQETLETVRSIEDAYSRTKILANLAEHLGKSGSWNHAVEAGRSITGALSRAKTLAAVAELMMEGDERKEVLQEALEVAKSIKEAFYRASALIAVAERIVEADERNEVLQEALEAARSIGEAPSRAKALIAVAERIIERDERKEVLWEAHKASISIKQVPSRANPLAAVAGHMMEGDERNEVLQEALEAARSMRKAPSRAKALAAVAECMMESYERKKILHEALKVARSIGEPLFRASALIAVAERIVEADERNEVLQEALEAARSIGEAPSRAKALAAVAKYLAKENGRKEVLQEALETARSIIGALSRAMALATVAKYLAKENDRKEVLHQALLVARSITIPLSRAKALAAVAENMVQADNRKEVLLEAFKVARSIKEAHSRTIVLTTVANHCIDLNSSRLPEVTPNVWLDLPDVFQETDRKQSLEWVIQTVASFAAIGEPGTLVEIAESIKDVGRWWP